MFTIEIKRAGYNVMTVTARPGVTISSLLRDNNVSYEGASIRFNGSDVSDTQQINSSGEIRILKNVKGN